MSSRGRVPLSRLSTGVPGLDDILGGGLPEYSFNLIVGEPGSGKTTLSHQIMFANASAERTALYFSAPGEPTLKMIRYLQQMSFFDPGKVIADVRFVDLSSEVLSQSLGKVLDRIVDEVKATSPAIVIVDSFRTVVRGHNGGTPTALQDFLQSLVLTLASWQATTFLVGEYLESERAMDAVFTAADGVLWLTQARERSSIVRRIQVMKLRGQASMPGVHTFRIDDDGLKVFPRVFQRMAPLAPLPPGRRMSTGISDLDALVGGGIPVGDTVLIAGPSGTGKSCLCTQMLAAAPDDVHAVLVVFEEHPAAYLHRAHDLGLKLNLMAERMKVISLRPLDLSVDEAMFEIRAAIEALGAKLLLIDSLSGFELALAAPFREDFRESLYRMMGVLTGMGVTVVMTMEVTESWEELRFNPHEVSFLTDDIIILRYAEIEGHLRKVLAIVKMRRSAHSTGLYEFEVTPTGILIKAPITRYEGILAGNARRRMPAAQPWYPGLTEEESAVLTVVLRAGEVTHDAVVAATGLANSGVANALGRLVAFDLALKVEEDGKTLYRPLARPLGGG